MKNQNKSIHNFPNFFMLFAPLLSSIIYLVYNLGKRGEIYNKFLNNPSIITIPLLLVIILLCIYFKYNHTRAKVLKAILWYLPLMFSCFYGGFLVGHGVNSIQYGLVFNEAIVLYGVLAISFCIMGLVLVIYLIRVLIRRGNKS